MIRRKLTLRTVQYWGNAARSWTTRLYVSSSLLLVIAVSSVSSAFMVSCRPCTNYSGPFNRSVWRIWQWNVFSQTWQLTVWKPWWRLSWESMPCSTGLTTSIYLEMETRPPCQCLISFIPNQHSDPSLLSPEGVSWRRKEEFKGVKGYLQLYRDIEIQARYQKELQKGAFLPSQMLLLSTSGKDFHTSKTFQAPLRWGGKTLYRERNWMCADKGWRKEWRMLTQRKWTCRSGCF